MRKSRRILFVAFVLVFALRSIGFGQNPSSSCKEILALFNSSSFEIFLKKREIPKICFQYLNAAASFDVKIAGFKKKYNDTGTHSARLPNRQLLFFAKSDSVWILGYEHGGRGIHNHIIFFSINNKDQIISDCILIGGGGEMGWDKLEMMIREENYYLTKDHY